MATWPSGKAKVCKTFITGSNPVVASEIPSELRRDFCFKDVARNPARLIGYNKLMNFIEELTTASRSGKAFAAAVIVDARGSTPRHAGAKMIVYEDGSFVGTVGGGAIEQDVMAKALDSLRTRTPALLHYEVVQSDGSVSGEESIYVEPSFPADTLILCGSGHVAGRLIPLAKSIGFRVVVIDIRPDEAVRERAREADEYILAKSFTEGLAGIPDREGTYCVACAFDFEHDEEILRELLKREKSAYIGMLSSRHKVQTIYNHLREQGVTDESLARVHATIGLPLGGETPEEIALSIAAELLKVRSGLKNNTTQELS